MPALVFLICADQLIRFHRVSLPFLAEIYKETEVIGYQSMIILMQFAILNRHLV